MCKYINELTQCVWLLSCFSAFKDLPDRNDSLSVKEKFYFVSYSCAFGAQSVRSNVLCCSQDWVWDWHVSVRETCLAFVLWDIEWKLISCCLFARWPVQYSSGYPSGRSRDYADERAHRHYGDRDVMGDIPPPGARRPHHPPHRQVPAPFSWRGRPTDWSVPSRAPFDSKHDTISIDRPPHVCIHKDLKGYEFMQWFQELAEGSDVYSSLWTNAVGLKATHGGFELRIIECTE